MTRRLPEANEAALREGFEATFREDGLDEAAAREALGAFDAVICTLGDAFTAEAFAGAGRARLLANFGVGVNHIDLGAARTAGVAVTNTPGAVTDATADVAMMLLLMAARRAGEGERVVRAGRWTGWEPTQLLGRHVTGMTVGIVGFGRIGQAVARRAHLGFGMRVLYAARSPKRPEVLAERVELPELLARADAVVLAVPGGAETRHLIGRGEMAAMKPGAILVNVARGGVVDEEALADALEAGRLGAAGLDVYDGEPAVNPRLLALENAVLLPHLGTATLAVRESMGAMAIANLVAFRDGRELPNPV